ncbi:embryonic stem cell-related gene protein-like isoform X4 [Pan troglodytes]|uniref:embryonic stem cell-related gene protein-like isoform X4 n=1 Tax=Pan troglodytes TaxID=9598 RepID=UPI0030141B09
MQPSGICCHAVISADAHEIWCHDSDRGNSLGRSIPCPPALCSMRKIRLRPQVLRPTSPRNISPISNPLKTDAARSPRKPRRPSRMPSFRRQECQPLSPS